MSDLQAPYAAPCQHQPGPCATPCGQCRPTPAAPVGVGAGEGEKVEMPDRYEMEATDLLLEAVATEAGDHTPAITGMVAHLLREHAADNQALLAEIASLRAKLAQEGEQELELLKRDEELRGLRAELATSQSQANVVKNSYKNAARNEVALSQRIEDALDKLMAHVRALYQPDEVSTAIQNRGGGGTEHAYSVGMSVGRTLLAKEVLGILSPDLLEPKTKTAATALPLQGAEPEAKIAATGWCARCTCPVFGGGTHCSACANIVNQP